jgi:4'-phosphopantetheinyl transferase EntD
VGDVVIETILPAGAVAVDTFTDPPDATLFAEEALVVRQAVEKRRLEFTTARWCARQAMSRLGRPPVAVLHGARGEPRWPAGLVGSITHCTGYRAAVLAESDVVTTVGIDAEPNEPLANGVLEAVARPDERVRIATLLRDHPAVRWDRLLFSAKESVYKAWFPLTTRWLDFEEADLTIDPEAGTFTARLLVTGGRMHGRALTGFAGRWLVEQGLIVTAIAVPAPVPTRPGIPLHSGGVKR